MKQKGKTVFLIGTLLIFGISGCSEPSINSLWQNSEIKIDGSSIDWAGSLNYYEDEKIAIGISNDNDFIYFCLATSDNDKIMRILRTGFTVWLDPQNSDGETIGIQYPIKRFDNEMMDGNRRDLKGQENIGDRLKNMISKFKVEQNEVLIVNQKNFPLNAYPLENETGLEVKIDYTMHQFVYELKIPLANNSQNPVYTDVLPNEKVSVGFETGAIDQPEKKSRSNMEKSGGDGMSGGGRGGNRGGGRGGKMESVQNNMDPIEFWIEVKLANKKIN